ncbi:hypothetical protein BDV93DRAFT_518642 [Ceratobasidium sp. AG-I]|nr:hypothetical protein BDV93DRAFT_518642 [Ceratobasidium sp. AG-I]
MSRFERSLPRRASRSEQPKNVSLELTKSSFLDTLIVHRSSGLPIYATMTQASRTMVYAIDARMTLRKIFVLNWGKGGKPSRGEPSLAIHGKLMPLDQIFPSRKRSFQSLWAKATDYSYSYGHFAYQWAEQDDPWYSGQLNPPGTACYRRSPMNPSPGSSPTLCTSAVGGIPVATLVLSNIRHRHKIQIDIHAQDVLEQTPGADGLTELDHIVLGALLVSTPPCDEKNNSARTDWASEEELQALLWSCLEGPAQGEVLPLYAVNTRAGSIDLPPYTSRERI